MTKVPKTLVVSLLIWQALFSVNAWQVEESISSYQDRKSQLLERVKKQLFERLAQGSHAERLLAFTGNIAQAVNRLDEYGCWCYFYEIGRGKGKPVDEVDGLCKTLAEGYECAIIDGGASCTQQPWEVVYIPGTGTGLDLWETCKTNNPDDLCAARACAVEGIFVDKLFAFLLSGNKTDFETFGHMNGFDTTSGCPVNPNGNRSLTVSEEPNKQCCGQYPDRYPFNTLDGDRACCASRTYNTLIMNCCGTETYNPLSKQCCGTKTYNPLSNQCCGTKTYNPLSMKCCGTKTYDPLSKQCCGTRTYNPQKKCCKNGRVKKSC